MKRRAWNICLWINVCLAIAASVTGATPEADPSDETSMRVNVHRDVVRSEVVLHVAGALRTRFVGENPIPSATFRLAVFPNQAAAENARADEDGSLFASAVTLTRSIVTRGAFAEDEFVVRSLGDGEFEARPNGSLRIHVPVPDANAAVIRASSGPSTPEQVTAVPGLGPFGVALLFLVLLASGDWVLRSRKTTDAT